MRKAERKGKGGRERGGKRKGEGRERRRERGGERHQPKFLI